MKRSKQAWKVTKHYHIDQCKKIVLDQKWLMQCALINQLSASDSFSNFPDFAPISVKMMNLPDQNLSSKNPKARILEYKKARCIKQFHKFYHNFKLNV